MISTDCLGLIPCQVILIAVIKFNRILPLLKQSYCLQILVMYCVQIIVNQEACNNGSFKKSQREFPSKVYKYVTLFE